MQVRGLSRRSARPAACVWKLRKEGENPFRKRGIRGLQVGRSGHRFVCCLSSAVGGRGRGPRAADRSVGMSLVAGPTMRAPAPEELVVAQNQQQPGQPGTTLDGLTPGRTHRDDSRSHSHGGHHAAFRKWVCSGEEGWGYHGTGAPQTLETLVGRVEVRMGARSSRFLTGAGLIPSPDHLGHRQETIWGTCSQGRAVQWLCSYPTPTSQHGP